MKKSLVLLMLALCTPLMASAEDIWLGPYLLFKGGTNVGSIPPGAKAEFNFHVMPDFGISSKMMFDENSALGLWLDAGLSTYSFTMSPEGEASAQNTLTFQPTYITLAPSLYFKGFLLGFALALPTGLGVTNGDGDDLTGQFLADVQDLNGPQIEARIGGVINVMKSDKSSLGIVLQVGYMVTGMFKDEYFDEDMYFNDKANNPNILSAGIGVNYLFNLNEL